MGEGQWGPPPPVPDSWVCTSSGGTDVGQPGPVAQAFGVLHHRACADQEDLIHQEKIHITGCNSSFTLTFLPQFTPC